MKRYEKLTKEEIIALTLERDCTKCQTAEQCDVMSEMSCAEVLHEYLMAECPPRLENVNNKADLEKAVEGFRGYCKERKCNECEYHMEADMLDCFKIYLLEEVI